MELEGAEEMIKSLTILFNRTLKEETVPVQWQRMAIKTLYKKGSKLEMSNKRGITNILSKLLEKILDMKTNPDNKLSEYQNGGKKNRSIFDNWILLMAIIDLNKIF